MAAGYAAKPGLLRSALKHLFSARKSDWDKFDGLFDAFWLGKRVRSRSMADRLVEGGQQSLAEEPAGQPAARRAAASPPPIRSLQPTMRRNARGEGRMEGASRAENLAEVDFRKLADPEQIAAGP